MASTSAAQQHQPASKPPGKLKTIALITAVAVLAACAASAGMYVVLVRVVGVGAPHTEAKAAPAPDTVPIFFALDTMTVNLQSDDGAQHYLRIGLSLKLADEKTQEHLTEHMPEIRSRILLALSNKRPEDLASIESKRALANDLKTLIEAPTEPDGARTPVKEVLFTEIVVQ